MTHAIIYARFSPRPNAAECTSNRKQFARCRAYCAAHDYKIVGVRWDRSVSGKRADNRPGLERALRDACKRKAVLIVYALDRLARHTRDAIDIVGRLHKANANLVMIEQHIDTHSPMGEFMFTVFAALAQLQRQQIAQITSDAMQFHQANGRRMGRADRTPFGKMVDPNDDALLVDCPEEQETLREMKKQSEAGRGPTFIARYLQTMCFPCRGRTWREAEVRKYLKRMNARSNREPLVAPQPL